MEKTLYQIFKTFFKVGTLLLGGGYVILPLLQSELVDKKKWIDSDDLCEYYALSQSIPGIIAVNISLFVGYRFKKTLGAITAVTGVITPAFLAIVILARILEEITNLRFVQSIFWGVSIGVILLLYLAIKEIWSKSIIDKFSCWVFFVTFVLSTCLKLPPAVIIILAIFIGLVLPFLKKNLRGKEKC